MAYQPIQMPQPDGLGGIAEFVMQLRNQANAENQRRAELVLRQQEAADQSAHRRAIEGNAAAQLKIQQDQANESIAQKRLKATTEITAALDQGRPDLARQIAKTFGIPLNEIPGQDPRDTLMKPSIETQGAPMPVEEGPQATPEIARRAGQIRAEQASFEPNAQPDSAYVDPAQAEASRFNLQQNEGPQAQVQFASAGLMPARGTQYEVNGEKYDPEQIREAEAARTKRNTSQFAGAMSEIEGFGKYIPVYQAGVAAGLTPKEAFNEMQARMKADDERAERSEDKRLGREQSDVNNRRIAAAMGNRVTHDDPFKNEAAKRGEEAAVDQMTKNVFGNLGFKETRTVGGKYTRMAQMLSKPNAASDAVVAGSFVKEAQGGSGVISDSDMEQFWGKIGGAETRTKQWVEGVLSGKIHPEKRAIVAQTVNALAQFELEKQDRIKDALRNRFDNSAFAHRTNDVLGTYFPAERDRIEEARKVEKAKQRIRAGRVKGGGRDALDEELDDM